MEPRVTAIKYKVTTIRLKNNRIDSAREIIKCNKENLLLIINFEQ